MTGKPRLARRSMAEAAASSLLHQMKIDGLRVDPEAIATSKGIMVKAKPDTAAGVSGMLIKVGDDFGIMYATNIVLWRPHTPSIHKGKNEQPPIEIFARIQCSLQIGAIHEDSARAPCVESEFCDVANVF